MSHYPNERGLRTGAQVPGAGHTYGESPASGPAPTTAGHHKHDLLNKIDPAVDSTRDNAPMPTTGNGPHRSRIANALDPRVDSHTGAAKPGLGATTGAGYGSHAAAAQPAMHGGAGVGAGMMSGSHGHGSPEGTYGPHSSRMANAADPRVDSDRDGRGQYGNHGTGYGGQPAGLGHTHNATYNTGGYGGQPAAGGIGAHHQQQGYGTHAAQAAMSGPGPATHTAGPHKSNLLNKLDPTVDSKTGLRK